MSSSRRVKFSEASAVAPIARARPPRAVRAVNTPQSDGDSDGSQDVEASMDECAFCGASGLVFICDVRGCARVYHGTCLGYEPADEGTFVCAYIFIYCPRLLSPHPLSDFACDYDPFF